MEIQKSLGLIVGTKGYLKANVKPSNAANKNNVSWNIRSGDNKIIMLSGNHEGVTVYADGAAGEAEVRAVITEFPGSRGRQLSDVCKVKVVDEGGILANSQFFSTETGWYSRAFTGSWSPQCAWYAIGRVGEVHGIKVDFNSKVGIDGETYKGSGGWWIKNIKSQASIATLNSDETIDIDETTKRDIKVIKSSDCTEDNIKSNSIASFLFYVDISNATGYYGHVQYIERVEKINGVTWVYFSDSNDSRGTGTIHTKIYADFIAQYSGGTAYEEEPIFQGFVQFD